EATRPIAPVGVLARRLGDVLLFRRADGDTPRGLREGDGLRRVGGAYGRRGGRLYAAAGAAGAGPQGAARVAAAAAHRATPGVPTARRYPDRSEGRLARRLSHYGLAPNDPCAEDARHPRLTGNERFCIRLVHHGNIHKACLAHHRYVRIRRDGPGDAFRPAVELRAQLRAELAIGHDVADGDAPARLQHAERLAEYGRFVRREVDYAVRHDHINCVILHRQRLDVPVAELDVLHAELGLVRLGLCQHLRRHIHADDIPGRADLPGRHKAVDAAAAAQI